MRQVPGRRLDDNGREAMALSFSERVRNYWWLAQEEGRDALVTEIRNLRETMEGMDHTGKVIGTGTDGNSVSLLRSQSAVIEEKLLAAREALVAFDAGERPGGGGRTVMIDRGLNRSVN